SGVIWPKSVSIIKPILLLASPNLLGLAV
ncbi:hypothetical protein D047_4707B, partial [Vibrio parahaemolyticus VPTS-2010_2]